MPRLILAARHLPQGWGPPPGWVLSGAKVDLDFANARYYAPGIANDVAQFLSCSRASVAYADTLEGTLTSFANDTLRVTTNGLLVEESRTNVALWNRDLSNAAWAKSSITAVKDQTGVDGGANSASSLTATAGNGTALQAITLGSSARFQSAYIKRLTGSGVINMTMDNGSTWTAVIAAASWALVTIPTQTLANPTIGFRIVTSGDAIAVDFVQNENGAFRTSPILTTTVGVTRATDIISGSALLKSLLTPTVGSLCVKTNALQINGSVFTVTYDSSNCSFGRYLTTTTIVSRGTGSDDITATLGSGSTSGSTKYAVGWDVSGRSLVANNGTVVTDAVGFSGSTTTLSVGATSAGTAVQNGYMQRLTGWASRLSDATLAALTI